MRMCSVSAPPSSAIRGGRWLDAPRLKGPGTLTPRRSLASSSPAQSVAPPSATYAGLPFSPTNEPTVDAPPRSQRTIDAALPFSSPPKPPEQVAIERPAFVVPSQPPPRSIGEGPASASPWSHENPVVPTEIAAQRYVVPTRAPDPTPPSVAAPSRRGGLVIAVLVVLAVVAAAVLVAVQGRRTKPAPDDPIAIGVAAAPVHEAQPSAVPSTPASATRPKPPGPPRMPAPKGRGLDGDRDPLADSPGISSKPAAPSATTSAPR